MDISKLFSGNISEVISVSKEIFSDSLLYYKESELDDYVVESFLDVAPLNFIQLSNSLYLSPKGIFLNTDNISKGDIKILHSDVLYVAIFKDSFGYILFYTISKNLLREDSVYIDRLSYNDVLEDSYNFSIFKKREYKFLFNRYFVNRFLSGFKVKDLELKVTKSDFNRFLSFLSLNIPDLEGVKNKVFSTEYIKDNLYGYQKSSDFSFDLKIPSIVKNKFYSEGFSGVKSFMLDLYPRGIVEKVLVGEVVEEGESEGDKYEVYKVKNLTLLVKVLGINLRILFRELRSKGYSRIPVKLDITSVPRIVRGSYISTAKYIKFLNEITPALTKKTELKNLVQLNRVISIIFNSLAKSNALVRSRFYIHSDFKNLLNKPNFTDRLIDYIESEYCTEDELLVISYAVYIPILYNIINGHKYKFIFENSDFIEKSLKLDSNKYIKLFDFVFLNLGKMFSDLFNQLSLSTQVTSTLNPNYKFSLMSARAIKYNHFRLLLRLILRFNRKILV